MSRVLARVYGIFEALLCVFTIRPLFSRERDNICVADKSWLSASLGIVSTDQQINRAESV